MDQKVHIVHVYDYLQHINMTGRFYHMSNVKIYHLVTDTVNAVSSQKDFLTSLTTFLGVQ